MREKWAWQTSDPGAKMRMQIRMRTQMWVQWRAERSQQLLCFDPKDIPGSTEIVVHVLLFLDI